MRRFNSWRYVRVWVPKAVLLGGLVFWPRAGLAGFNRLHDFGVPANDGRWPAGNVIERDGWLYGLTPYGGSNDCGTLFKVSTNGAQYRTLYWFDGANGKYPLGSLLLYSNKFYGLTARGGAHDAGVVFEIGTNGAGYTVRHVFDAEDENNGGLPWGSLVAAGQQFYGMTFNGGISNYGVVFSLNPANWAFAIRHRFRGGQGDGKRPQGDLLVDGNTLYGMTTQGGSNDAGVVFALNCDGSGYRNIHEFTGHFGGENPAGGLLLDGGYLYGMARGGRTKAGLAFCVRTNGGTLHILREFTGAANDGADPYGSLIRHDGVLYGMTRFGGTNSQGVVFAMGGYYTNLHSFGAGGEPYGALTAVGGRMYGMACNEGLSNNGCVFGLDAGGAAGAEAWCAITWIDGGGMGASVKGDRNERVMYVQHNTNGLAPDYAFVGYGRTANFDDDTWTWLPLGQRPGLYGDPANNYEFTGSLGRAVAPGNYFVAAKFIKGAHVYYPPAGSGWNAWGNWDTPLYSTFEWQVRPLALVSNAAAAYLSATQLTVQCQSDGHYVVVFRQSGAGATFGRPADDTAYTVGADYPGLGRCVYFNAAGAFTDSSLASNTTYTYAIFTENNYFYSESGVVVSASTTNPNADSDLDQLPDWWEQRHFGGVTNAAAGADSDGDGRSNWEEYVAVTDPTNPASVFAATSAGMLATSGVATNYGANLVLNGGFSDPGSAVGAAWWDWGYPDGNGWRWSNAQRQNWDNHTVGTTSNFCGIISGTWMGDNNGGMGQRRPIAGAGDYEAAGWFRIESGWVGANRFKLEFLDGNAVVLTAFTNTLTGVGAGWTLVNLPGVAPAGAQYGQVVVESSGIGANGTMYFDDITLRPVTRTANTAFGITWYAWTGRVYAVESRANLLSPWVGVPGLSNIVVPQNGNYTAWDTNTGGVATRFYHVSVRLP